MQESSLDRWTDRCRAQAWTCDWKAHKIDVILLKNQVKSFLRTLFFLLFCFFHPTAAFDVLLSWNYQQPRCRIEKKIKKNLASGSESHSGMFTSTNRSFAVCQNWPKVNRASAHVDGQVLVLDQELLCHSVSSCLDYCKATSAVHYSVVEHTDHADLSTFSHT